MQTKEQLEAIRGMHAGLPAFVHLADRLAYIKAALAGTPYDDWMMFTDDSFWEPSVDYTNLSPFLGTICTRGGGPATWTEGAYGDGPDKYWFDKAQKIRATGLSLGAYWVVNFGLMYLDWKRPAPVIDAMKTAFYGKYIPDWIALDIEVATFNRGNNVITIPGPNLTTGFTNLLEAVWEEWRKTVFVYSRVTWMEEYTKMPDGTIGF